jgi:hypothetical protein
MTSRNYTPTRIFITKWDIEKENNKTKQKSIQRERRLKYDIYKEETMWVKFVNTVIKTIKPPKKEEHQWEEAFPWP